MTTIQKPIAKQTTAPDAAVDELPIINQLAGFVPELSSNTGGRTSALFLSLEAARTVGTPLYTLDNEGGRQYLPPTFVGKLLSLEVVEKDYGGNYQAQTKLLVRLLIGGSTFVLHTGLNSWCGQSLLTSLSLLNADELAVPLKFRMVAGKRTCFCRLSTGSDNNGWSPVQVADETLLHKLEPEQLSLLADAVQELL